MLANLSENAMISGATQLLISKGWPNQLVIFNKNYYLQNSAYIDKVPGIDWVVVVIVPAPAYDNYLGPSSSLYFAVVSISSVTIALTVIGMVVTGVFW